MFPVVTPCTALPCQNGGTCDIIGDDFTCTCQTGFIGRNCENVDGELAWMQLERLVIFSEVL